MELLFQQLFNGIMLGSTYSLFALGLTLVYGILNVPNFAHGHMYMLGAYIGLFFMTVVGIAYWPALAITAILMAAAGVLLDWCAYRPLRNEPHISAFISALGALFVLENGVIALWGPQGQRMPNPYPEIVEIMGIIMTKQRLLVIIGAALLILLVQFFIKKTILGSTIEAMAQNQEGARLVGVNVDFVSSLTFALSTGLAAIAAMLVAPIFMLSPTMGSLLGLKGFVIIILGGLGSIPGAIVGGLILGLIEALGGGYVSAAYKDAFAFGALILILAIKPTGLFGKEVTGR